MKPMNVMKLMTMMKVKTAIRKNAGRPAGCCA